MKINRKIAAAATVITLTAAIVSGCANPQKAGTQALESGEYKEALSQFEEASQNKNDKKAAEGYRGLGMTYFETEDYQSALKAFRKAVDRGAEKTPQLYNLMGICAMQTEDYKSGLQYIQAGLDLADSSSEGEKVSEDLIKEMRYNEIICYERQADWENARKSADDYLKDYPDDDNVQKEAEFLETR